MQVSSLNEVKIYSLSCGKSLPEWLSDRKKRALQKKDVDVRRRIELIQDFEMPTVCTTIKVSKDGQYILATGTYKPRVRCYDTYQLSLKFERCLDSEVVTFETLSDDYSKIVFLHNDRYIEFHSQSGFYYKTRIPKFGRDFSYHYPSCDLYFVGASSEVYRLNLEQGRYLNPLQTDAAENNVCDINSVHGLFATGTVEGRVECWDPRVRSRVGLLDCALSSVTADSEVNSLPTISALKFNGALTMAVGTSTGQVLLYDLRSDKPLLVKDHQYGLPIKSVHFQNSLDLILSADSRIIKMWNKNSGKIFTSLEPEHDINDVCLYPNSGMLLTANETPKMGIYYIPNLPNILTDDRFKVMFENPDFQVDEESEEFRLLNPLVSKISEKRKKKLRLLEQQEAPQKEEEEELEGRPSDAESSESSDDEKGWVDEVRKQRRLLQQEERARRQERLREDQQTVLRPQFYEIKAGEEFRSFKDSATRQRLRNKTLEDRLKLEAKNGTLSVSDTTVGSKQLTFTLKRSEQQKQQQAAEKMHRQERKALRRPAGHLKSRRKRGRPFP
ncbi:nucleolar protein 10 isoform X2 [Pipistrellus kuhlii]|uniref:nucleolar protein 10 isoform X2 n=1 Tax=Pipistrellus kuhlii TaxID=59472 RepID=UPI00174EFC7E|nr:nucleolar protein 10 isoform X2 [Pipistrellus kuhlii]